MLKYLDAQGRVLATDETAIGAPAIIDTNDGMLFADPADYFAGSVTLPARSASSSGVDGSQNVVDLTAEYFVGTPSAPLSNIVLGQFRKSGDTMWRSAWGTHILNVGAVGDTFKPGTDLVSQNYLASLRTVTPVINTLGHLALRERTIMRSRDPGSPPSITLTFPAITLNYALFAGQWWGNPFQLPRADADLRRGGPYFCSTTTFSNAMNAGYGYQGRRLVVVIQNALRATNPTAVSIGGVTATIHGTISTAETRTTIASAIVPTGENPTVVINNATASNTWVGVSLFATRSLTGNAPTVYSTSAASGTATSLSIPAASQSVAIVVSTKNGGTAPTCTWTNATEVLDTDISGFYGAMSSAIMENLNGSDVTATWTTAANDITMMAAVFT